MYIEVLWKGKGTYSLQQSQNMNLNFIGSKIISHHYHYHPQVIH
jgi:hypothetical protein